jgi:TolB-like protein/Tfp pilus assembly protein PilF/tRNA A-37 threonylcarbamoyl transferase component Bud32
VNQTGWKKLEEVFNAAVEVSPVERKAFLDDACGTDAELRREVERLLQADELAGDFIEDAATILQATDFVISVSAPDDSMIDRQIGAYKIEREIGRGGMGAVYLASRADKEFAKRVAIKIVKRGMDTDFIIRRFRNERQILANLDHPNIAKLLDGGTTDDGLPYFVMEHIEGIPISRYADENRLTIRERLQLFQKVCAAVHYAHQNNVIHRDIKPGNILVTADGTPKLLDFGIAKLLNPDPDYTSIDTTATAMRLMTPEFASPEQARGEVVTAASDQYSLGVLLYELLTGHRPYHVHNRLLHEIARVVCEVEPEKPSLMIRRTEEVIYPDGKRLLLTPQAVSENRNATSEELRRVLAGGLDNIVLKVLRKQARYRYDSVANLAEDIGRFLHGEAVVAPDPGTVRIGKADTDDPQIKDNSIAVLPFKLIELSHTEDTGGKFLSVGLADALITRLSNVRSLTVRPTTSVLRFAHEDIDAPTVGRELQVYYILDGRILKSGDRIRVTAQLINVKTQTPQWAAQYDEQFQEIFDLQDSIAARVAEEIARNITTEERQQLARHGTNNIAAYELYLRGRYHWHSFTDSGFARAVTCFYDAIALDENFAAAYSGVADYHIALGINALLPPAECFSAAKDAAAKAVQLDDKLAEAYASLAFAVWAYDWNAEESEQLFNRAIELNTNYAQVYEWYAHFCAAQGHYDKALEAVTRALELDPFSPLLHILMALVLHSARRFEEGIRYIGRALELEPNNYIALQGYGWMYPLMGRAEEAIAPCRKAVEISGRAPMSLWTLGYVLGSAGKTEEARRVIDELERIAETRYVSPNYFVTIYVALGEIDKAFEYLNRAIDDREYWVLWLGVTPRLDRLRADPRFADVKRRLKELSQSTIGISIPPAHGDKQVTAAVEEKLPDTLPQETETRRLPAWLSGRPLYQWLILAGIILVLGIIGFYLFRQSSPDSTPEKMKDKIVTPVINETDSRKSIAILPFRITSGEEEERQIGIGLTTALISDFGKIKQLAVRPASAVRNYAEKNIEPEQAGAELSVEYIVSGTLQRNGESIRVSAQMVNTKDGSTIWADRFNEPLDKLAVMQNAIAERALRALSIELNSAELLRLTRRATQNHEAYQLYIVGRYHWSRRTIEGLQEGIKNFTEASRKDPNFALAYAGLADCYALLNQYQSPPPADAYAKAKENAMKALSLDDSLAEAHTSLGYVKFYGDRDRVGAEQEFRRAIELNPSYATAHHWLAMILSAMGRHDEAIQAITQAQQLDPRTAIIQAAAGTIFFHAQRYEEAIERCHKALELDSGLVPAYRVLRWTYEAMRRYDEAFAAYQNEKSFSGDSNTEWTVVLAQLNAIGGKAGEAQLLLKMAAEAKWLQEQADYQYYEIGVAYALLNDRDQAMNWLAKAEAIRSILFNYAAVDPRLNNLRNDARFTELLKKGSE